MNKEELYKYLVENLSLDFDPETRHICLCLGDDVISSVYIND